MQNNIKKAIYTPNIFETLLNKIYKVLDYSKLTDLISAILETKEVENLCNYIDKDIIEPILNDIKKEGKKKCRKRKIKKIQK